MTSGSGCACASGIATPRGRPFDSSWAELEQRDWLKSIVWCGQVCRLSIDSQFSLVLWASWTNLWSYPTSLEFSGTKGKRGAAPAKAQGIGTAGCLRPWSISTPAAASLPPTAWRTPQTCCRLAIGGSSRRFPRLPCPAAMPGTLYTVRPWCRNWWIAAIAATALAFSTAIWQRALSGLPCQCRRGVEICAPRRHA